MTCILKAPSARSKGVVVFTTQERDRVIRDDGGLRTRLEALKESWLVGLHHNWHDEAFDYDPLFDFSMAGEGDLRERSGRPFLLIPLDACNFVPPAFHPGRGEKFWDLLYVARDVGFKRLPQFLEVIRSLFDAGHRIRVLCISPLPPRDPAERKSEPLRRRYEALFSDEEQDLFTLLDLSFRYPFPFDLETLAFFYRSSRAFVHLADNERRCRVAAYAWAAGLPVVAAPAVASLLPPELRREPYWFQVDDASAFPSRILAALDAARDGEDTGDARAYFSPTTAHARLLASLRDALADPLLSVEELAVASLDIRLGRHHGISLGGNRVGQSVDAFLDVLVDREAVRAALDTPDPEKALAASTGAVVAARRRLPRRGGLRRILR